MERVRRFFFERTGRLCAPLGRVSHCDAAEARTPLSEREGAKREEDGPAPSVTFRAEYTPLLTERPRGATSALCARR